MFLSWNGGGKVNAKNYCQVVRDVEAELETGELLHGETIGADENK